jgi:hypothetical protein
MAVVLPLHAQIAPPTESPQYAAKVINLTGAVSVLKDNQPWALGVGDTIQVKQIIVSGNDGHAVFQVSDGSTFEVFPNSHVVFRKNAPNWRDLIDVIVGRVKVHIQHWGNQPNPNRIFTPTAVISVRGTTFDVSVDEETEATLVEVVEGEVAVTHALQGGNGVVLRTGESITVYRTQPIAARGVDKGTVIQHALRSIMDALQTMATRTPRGGVGGVGGSPGGTVGDTTKPAPPPPPPPPPPGPPL